jgi:hypothetical protein
VRRGLRVAYLVAAVLLLLILPVGNVTMLLALFVAVDLAAAVLMLRPAVPQPTTVVVALDTDAVNLTLMRRTVPALRMRRPTATIEAQILWRQAAETHRQRRALFRSTRRK